MQNQNHHNIFVGTTYNTLLSIVCDTWICPLHKNLSQLLCWTCYIAYCQICILISDFVKSIYQKQTQVRLCLLKKYHFGVFFIQMPKTLFRMAKVLKYLYKKIISWAQQDVSQKPGLTTPSKEFSETRLLGAGGSQFRSRMSIFIRQ